MVTHKDILLAYKTQVYPEGDLHWNRALGLLVRRQPVRQQWLVHGRAREALQKLYREWEICR